MIQYREEQRVDKRYLIAEKEIPKKSSEIYYSNAFHELNSAITI